MSADFIEANIALVLAVVLWEMVWKGFALWLAARRGDKPWFVLLLILNTVGILPIAYILVFRKRSLGEDKRPVS